LRQRDTPMTRSKHIVLASCLASSPISLGYICLQSKCWPSTNVYGVCKPFASFGWFGLKTSLVAVALSYSHSRTRCSPTGGILWRAIIGCRPVRLVRSHCSSSVSTFGEPRSVQRDRMVSATSTVMVLVGFPVTLGSCPSKAHLLKLIIDRVMLCVT
jgi:hypothetical protein